MAIENIQELAGEYGANALLEALEAALDAQTPAESDMAELRLLRLIHGVRWQRFLHAAQTPVYCGIFGARGCPRMDERDSGKGNHAPNGIATGANLAQRDAAAGIKAEIEK